jgi:hypothetical protein
LLEGRLVAGPSFLQTTEIAERKANEFLANEFLANESWPTISGRRISAVVRPVMVVI